MNELEAIKIRLFSCLQNKKLHLAEFIKLLDVRFDENIKTAAVTCEKRSTLLLNKKFIEEHCSTDEHLFVLILHEMYHILLGHTKLFKNDSDIDNIVLDAIINSLICKEFPGEEYTSFFTDLYNDSSLPSALLRPIGNNTPKNVKKVLKMLYEGNFGTYYEIYEFLNENLTNLNIKLDISILLGNHDSKILKDPIIEEFIKKYEKELTETLKRIKKDKSAGYSTEISKNKTDLKRASKSNINKMNTLLKKALVTSYKYSYSRHIDRVKDINSMPFINSKDRTFIAKKMAYDFTPVLYNNEITNYRFKNIKHKTLIYIDVSGSVCDKIGDMFGLLLPAYRNNEITLKVFSNAVRPVTFNDLKEGNYKSTGGTDFNCVFEDYFKSRKDKRRNKLIIFTDLCGNLEEQYLNRIKKENVEVYIGDVYGEAGGKGRDLANIAKHVEVFNF